MKIYLAARYSRNDEMRGVRDVLGAFGHEVTSRWIDCHADVVGDHTSSFTQEFLNASPELSAPLGEHDLDDLIAADTVISFTGSGSKGGRHVEFGYGLALGKRVILVGPRENIFHTLAEVEHYEDWSRLVMALTRESRSGPVGVAAQPTECREFYGGGLGIPFICHLPEGHDGKHGRAVLPTDPPLECEREDKHPPHAWWNGVLTLQCSGTTWAGVSSVQANPEANGA